MPGASCKGIRWVQGMLHLGIDDVCSLSGPWEQTICLLISNLYFYPEDRICLILSFSFQETNLVIAYNLPQI